MTQAANAAAVDETAAAPAEDDAGETVTFKGETFTLNDEVSEFALAEFAEAASNGEDGDSLQGMASLLRFVLELITPKDRTRFRAVARRERATFDDLFAFLRGEVEAETDRPTGQSPGSSGGHETTPAKSGASFGGKGSPLAGRPDLAFAVEEAVRRAA